MKYKIEKNTVQETLIIPLYARKVCSELYPNLYQDETAVRLIDEIDYDFSESEKKSRSLTGCGGFLRKKAPSPMGKALGSVCYFFMWSTSTRVKSDR